MDLKQWAKYSGLERKALTRALNTLEVTGLLNVQRTAHGRTLWLPATEDLFQMSLKGTADSSSSSRLLTTNEIESNLLPPQPHAQKRTPAILTALDEAGIREPARSRLAALTHITPELIRAHVENVREERARPGAAIYRIEHNWPTRTTATAQASYKADSPTDEPPKPFTAPFCLHFEPIQGDQVHATPCLSRKVLAGERYCKQHLPFHTEREQE